MLKRVLYLLLALLNLPVLVIAHFLILCILSNALRNLGYAQVRHTTILVTLILYTPIALLIGPLMVTDKLRSRAQGLNLISLFVGVVLWLVSQGRLQPL